MTHERLIFVFGYLCGAFVALLGFLLIGPENFVSQKRKKEFRS